MITDANKNLVILANRIQQNIKRIIHDDQAKCKVGSTCKPINVIHYINRMKKKIHMIISTDAENANIQYAFVIERKKAKAFNETRKRRELQGGLGGSVG